MLKSLSDVNPEEFLDTREKQHLEMAVLASIMEKAIIRHHQFIKSIAMLPCTSFSHPHLTLLIITTIIIIITIIKRKIEGRSEKEETWKEKKSRRKKQKNKEEEVKRETE